MSARWKSPGRAKREPEDIRKELQESLVALGISKVQVHNSVDNVVTVVLTVFTVCFVVCSCVHMYMSAHGYHMCCMFVVCVAPHIEVYRSSVHIELFFLIRASL